MKELKKYALCLTLLLFVISSCNNKQSNEKNTAQKNSKLELVEKPIDNTGFLISIPSDYSIKTSNGPDFSVYYFSPADTSKRNKLSGGLYFGNFPNKFEPDNDSCKIESIKGKILDSLQEWVVYNCQGNYSIQTIVDNKNGEEWNQQIHAFGNAKSIDELQTILEIYSTLKEQRQHVKK